MTLWKKQNTNKPLSQHLHTQSDDLYPSQCAVDPPSILEASDVSWPPLYNLLQQFPDFKQLIPTPHPWIVFKVLMLQQQSSEPSEDMHIQ